VNARSVSAVNRLTARLGQKVWSGGADPVGKLLDLIVDVRGDAPRTTRLVVGSRRLHQEVDWHDVVRFDEDRIELGPHELGPASATPPVLGPHELSLARDVLDAQIVDLTGHRLVRAGDVVLTPTDDGDLVVVGIDVGFGAVLRRIGLPGWLARAEPELVAWDELHLASRRGHEVQLVAENAHLHHLSPEDLAHLLARLSTEHAGAVLKTASADRAAAAIAASHDEVGGRLLASMDSEDAHAVLDALPPARAHALRRHVSKRGRARRYHRTRGWKRHAPPEPPRSPAR
jgi:hypothetical protein